LIIAPCVCWNFSGVTAGSTPASIGCFFPCFSRDARLQCPGPQFLSS
jgi:hypothetical protein